MDIKKIAPSDIKSLRLNSSYKSFLKDIKNRIKVSQFKIAQVANQELITFYWELGKLILSQQKVSTWGDKIIDALAIDLQRSFPDTKGFSRTNLHSMRLFAEIYPSKEIVQTLSGQLPWSHNVLLISRLKDAKQREWYATQAIQQNWSYRRLQSEIKSDLHTRQAHESTKITNFSDRLSGKQSNLAIEMIKDPYRFDFLSFNSDAHEIEIQKGLVSHVRQFLLALGQGFAFYDSKYSLRVSNKSFEIDLLMYHTRLHCYVVIELKRGDFKPKDTGQLNFYLSAVDEQLKMPEDNPTIGLLLCENKDRVIAEYALRDVNKPIGISEFNLSKALPKILQENLPSIKEIEAELNSQEIKDN